jgi:bifunctional non-homologous end joining protein LigD
MIQDVASLMWVINLGCIDLNQWYARCDDVDRPDYIHFDLDPVPNASFEKVCEAALYLKLALDSLKIPSYVKTTGSKGIHIYIPIKRGPTQKQVWMFAKEFAHAVASQAPKLLTAVYQVSKRPKGRVLVDYNQNAWGRTLASLFRRLLPGKNSNAASTLTTSASTTSRRESVSLATFGSPLPRPKVDFDLKHIFNSRPAYS